MISIVAEIGRTTKKTTLNSTVVVIMTTIMAKGWTLFAATSKLLRLGAVAFAAALVAFLGTGVGLLVALALVAAGFVAREAILLLYENRSFVLAVWRTGKKYKHTFEYVKDNPEQVEMLRGKITQEILEQIE